MTGRNLTMAVLGMAALLMAGCGGEDDTPTALDTEETETTPTPLETEATPTPLETEETETGDTDVGEVSEECQQAVDEVAGAEDLSTAAEQVDTAISTCVDLQELRSAADDLEGVDMAQIESFVAERCEAADDPLVTESPICEEVTG